jgi:hypothetical protein
MIQLEPIRTHGPSLMHIRLVRLLILTVLVLGQPGCSTSYNELPIGFVNLTRMSSDTYLMSRWHNAQRAVAAQVDLNPIGRLRGEPAHSLPGDARALNIPPRQIAVQAVPDVSSQQLLAATGVLRSDPTGFVLCPPPCNVTYDSSYTIFGRRYVAYAASWEFAKDPQVFAQILEYEFQSQILYRLGYDVSER